MAGFNLNDKSLKNLDLVATAQVNPDLYAYLKYEHKASSIKFGATHLNVLDFSKVGLLSKVDLNKPTERDVQFVADKKLGDTTIRFKTKAKGSDIQMTAVLFHHFNKHFVFKSAHTIDPVHAVKNHTDFGKTYKFGLCAEFTY